MFTMSLVDGYSISKKDRVIEEGYDLEEIGRNIVENYAHQVLDVGVFHADPHQGNIMISHGKPVWIDFGMIGRITTGDINIVQSIVLALLEKDVETIANAIMSMGASTAQTNRDRMIEDLDVFLDRYCSVTSINDLDVSVLFEEICDLAAKHHVKMPGRFTMLVRSLATIEGVIEQFCPELNLFEILSSKMMDRAKKSFDLEQEIMTVGKDMLEISKKTAKIPALASDALKGLARGRTKINLELTGYEELINKGSDTIRNIILAVFSCVIFFGSCIMCTADLRPKAPGGMPVIATVGLVFSVALAIHAIGNMTRKK
jgi:ubiquinone biosynthesis protein